ncbi:molybdate transporter 1-like [Forsythia ovata]|uniref:Molybdate transporter 1-like n=1 Tax=Forsythia ovata TaxID=205694 RepID=A0ABD1XAR2_9LAMI
MATTKFDFSPFLKHHHHHRWKYTPEIDPRYGVEKRLVPTELCREKWKIHLFPEKDVSATSVFGIMNLIGCWFGATPCYRGAEELAEQYKFGGRSGGCVALLGVAKLVLGLILGSSLVNILDQFPVGVLWVLLLFAGIELDMCSRDMNSKEESVVMLICTLFHLLAQMHHLDFFVGLLCIYFLGQEDWVMANLVPENWAARECSTSNYLKTLSFF